MKYEDLSDRAKEHAYHEWIRGAANYNWWDDVYEMAKEEGTQLGFLIDDISFSGFWSQGDGASWKGFVNLRVWVDSDACTLNDREKMFLKTAFEQYLASHTIDITNTSNYCHSGTMVQRGFEVYRAEACAEIQHGVYAGMSEEAFVDELAGMQNGIENEVLQSARYFADKIYRDLEEEYESITSEEAFADFCEANDVNFDEEGDVRED